MKSKKNLKLDKIIEFVNVFFQKCARHIMRHTEQTFKFRYIFITLTTFITIVEPGQVSKRKYTSSYFLQDPHFA